MAIRSKPERERWGLVLACLVGAALSAAMHIDLWMSPQLAGLPGYWILFILTELLFIALATATAGFLIESRRARKRRIASPGCRR